MARESLREPVVCRIAADDDGEVRAAARDATDAPVVEVGPTGAHALEPLLLVTRGERTAFVAGCTPARAREVVRRAAEGDLPDGADAVVSHDPHPATLPVPDLAPLSVGTRSVLGPCGWVRPTDPEDHRAAGGFESLRADRDALLAAAREVTGRGWGDAAADDPVGETWARVAETDGDPAVVVNGHGAPGDRLLLDSVPFLALEGALTAARVVDASEVVVYLSAADGGTRARVAAAVEALPSAATDEGDGGADRERDALPAGVDVRVVTGPEAYRAAEPTMALEAIEGNHRLEARLRPPGPDVEGLHGRPTLVHTPRTLAQVVRVAGGAAPTRVFAVRGDVRDAATVELRESASLSALREAVAVDGGVKAASVGGRFGGLTPDLDVAASASALAAAGLGTGGVVEVLDDERCVVAHVGERTRFGEAANCGRCVPCREGSTQLLGLLREVYDGAFERERIAELLRVVRSTSLCPFGREMARPTATALDHFADEFAAHAEGRCPAGTCTGEAPEVTP